MNTKSRIFLLLSLTSSIVAADTTDHGEPPLRAPFLKGEDSLCINDWWKRPASEIIDLKVPRDQVVCFGIYTVHNRILKLTAQLYPLFPKETREVRLEIEKDGVWTEVARQKVNDLGWSTSFRIADWDDSKNVKYRLRHGENASFEGLIRKNPADRDEIEVAALSCNSNKDRGLRPEYVRNINHQNPDLVFFAGDQSYDHKQHTAAWLKFGLAFRDIFRERPCVTIPDDHDIGQGNLWGEGGKIAKAEAGHDGGYFFHHEYVKMVERQQCAHLPDPYDPTPVGQGIGVYHTRLLLGGIDFAIIEDRKFKTGPLGRHPMKGPRPDHIRDPDYDPKVIDTPGLQLLGERQEKFLTEWGKMRDSVAIKAVLSQTGFCGGAHLHGSRENRLHADLDSNGWPQSGRNRALELIQQARAVHIAGDQHIATLIQHGIRDFRDGPWAFVVPAIVNNYYGRWWWPEDEKPGANPIAGSPLPWTGDYLDGIQSLANMNGAITVDSGATFNFSQSFTANNLDNNITLSGTGTGGLGALNLWRNATVTGAITLAADATISHDFSRGIINGSITATNHNLTLTTLNAGQPGLEVNGSIQLGTGGITVNGVANILTGVDFSVKLTGNNSYSGETHVVAGKLWLSGDARLNDASTVRIASGAVLHLDFAGADTVGALYFGGDPNPKADGTYGSLTSTAVNKSANFAGNGILQVGAVASNTYDSWASTNAGSGDPDEDFDKDGVRNGVEYFMGETGSSFTANPSLQAGKVTWPKDPTASSASYSVETSDDLAIWIDVTTGVVDTGSSVEYTVPTGDPKRFARLKVTVAP